MPGKSTVKYGLVALFFGIVTASGGAQSIAGLLHWQGRGKSLAELNRCLNPAAQQAAWKIHQWEQSPALAVFDVSPPAGPLAAPTNATPPSWHSVEWSAEQLPFFCRIEYRLGKKTRVPFKFRLGSVEYVDWLEGKPGCSTFIP